jgi:hypothetical protein
MATSVQQVKYVELSVALKSSLEARAGNTPEEVAAGRFKTKSNAPRSIFQSLLGKLVTAISEQNATIDITVQDDKWIIKDKDDDK